MTEPLEMRAALLEAPGKPLTIVDDIEIRAPRAGEVRVEVKHCGLCHSDLSIMNGSFPAGMPIVLGHEAAGIVESVGEGVTHLSPGDHVVLSPCPPCGKCYWCVRGEHAICEHLSGIMTNALPDGSTGLSRGGESVFRGLGVGAFAQYVITTDTGAIKIPNEVPLGVACVVGCAVQTGVGAALNTAQITEGDTVLVLGLGGIGASIVQGARLAGASKIFVSDPVAERREMARGFGATHLIDPNETTDVVAHVMEQTGVGVDYAFEAAGVGALVELAIGATRNGGTIVMVGAPPITDQITVIPAIMVIQQKKITGCTLGGCNPLHDIPRMIDLYMAGRLDLEGMISHRRPLGEINEAADDLAAGRGVRTVLDL
ncbi:MAG: Zn-dependent alcohol dehydrogenase [Myxococcota bacterium]|jgi:Zn-dependent alcohol dehydrogenase|nr:Zn-dependent alcohol dehydrogenase [Myxococcota bacterium]